MHRFVYAMAVGIVVTAAVVAVRPGASPARSAQDARADDARASWTATAERTQARRELAAALVRGERTVPDAVARFRDLLADDPVVLHGLRAQYPDAPLDELAARQAASYVKYHPAGGPARCADLARELDALARAARPVPATAARSFPPSG